MKKIGKSECDYQDPDTTTAKIVLKTKDGGYKKGDNAWVENANGKNTSSFPISGDSYKLTYYQNGQQLSQRPTEPGDYSVTLTMNQVSVSGEFTITKAEYYTNKIYFKDKNWKEQDNCEYTYQGYQSEFGPYVKVNDWVWSSYGSKLCRFKCSLFLMNTRNVMMTTVLYKPISSV